VSNLVNNGVEFGMMWLDIEGPAYWGRMSENVDFCETLIDTLDSLGVSVGIYASRDDWLDIMGDYSPTPPLWYVKCQQTC
jgi:hypothetical protein